MTTEQDDDITQDERPTNHRKLIAMAAVPIPVVAFFALLGGALGPSGGVPAGLAILSCHCFSADREEFDKAHMRLPRGRARHLSSPG